MNKKKFYKCLFFLGSLLFFTFLPQIMPTPSSVAQASEIEREKNNETRLNLKILTLVNGKSFTLRVYNLKKDAKVSFKSADPDIASVNDNGTLTANKVGKTTITATVRRGITPTTFTCEVTVGPPAFSIRTTRSMIVLTHDQNAVLDVIMKPGNTAELAKFSSGNRNIATISSGGRITAKKLGMTKVFAQIDATNPDGKEKYASCSVIVSSTEDAEQLNSYFADHYELSLISETDLTNALLDFFNTTEEVTEPEDPKTQDTLNTQNTQNTQNTTAASVPTPTPSALNNSRTTQAIETANKAEAEEKSEPTLIESLDIYLNSIFDLENLRQKYDELFKIVK